MRRLTLQDLPQMLRALGAPPHIRHALGDYSRDNQYIGPDETQGYYDEYQILGCSPEDLQALDALSVDGHSLGMLQTSPGDAPGFDDIVWSSAFYSGSAGQLDIQIAADRSRVILIVEKTDSSAIPVGVNFGAAAQIFGAAPNGIQLYSQGSVLYVDKYCPTNDIHLNLLVPSSLAVSACVVVVGTRGQPKTPLPASFAGEQAPPEMQLSRRVGHDMPVSPRQPVTAATPPVKKPFSNFRV
jgi:hypothetical protein